MHLRPLELPKTEVSITHHKVLSFFVLSKAYLILKPVQMCLLMVMFVQLSCYIAVFFTMDGFEYLDMANDK